MSKEQGPRCGKKGGAGKKTPKLVMRDMHFNKSLKGIYVAVSMSLLSGFLFYMVHNRPKINAYRNFYANYDPEASFNRMMEAGVLSSCPPGSADEEQDKKKK